MDPETSGQWRLPAGLNDPAGVAATRVPSLAGRPAITPAGVLARAAELAAAGSPFVLATVVAVQRPTSAKPGARGIIHPDRTIEGWVGGSCAQPIVVREALRSLADGQPRLLRLSKNPPSDSRRADGIIDYVMTCHSGGTLEIFVEPQLPAPSLWIAGVTPIARALVALGGAAGFEVTLLDPDAAPDGYPAASRVLDRTDLEALDTDASPFVVIATQGQWDEEALQGALRRSARYVGVVTSPTRAAALKEFLRDAGVAEDAIASLRAPAGLDIGAETPEEVALSILSELVALRHRPGAPQAATAGPTPEAASSEPTEAGDIVLLDPVCGMTVEREDVRYIAEFDATVYAFCSLTCRNRFQKNPSAYLAPAAADD